jgi:hypothetical protein
MAQAATLAHSRYPFTKPPCTGQRPPISGAPFNGRCPRHGTDGEDPRPILHDPVRYTRTPHTTPLFFARPRPEQPVQSPRFYWGQSPWPPRSAPRPHSSQGHFRAAALLLPAGHRTLSAPPSTDPHLGCTRTPGLQLLATAPAPAFARPEGRPALGARPHHCTLPIAAHPYRRTLSLPCPPCIGGSVRAGLGKTGCAPPF